MGKVLHMVKKVEKAASLLNFCAQNVYRLIEKIHLEGEGHSEKKVYPNHPKVYPFVGLWAFL